MVAGGKVGGAEGRGVTRGARQAWRDVRRWRSTVGEGLGGVRDVLREAVAVPAMVARGALEGRGVMRWTLGGGRGLGWGLLLLLLLTLSVIGLGVGVVAGLPGAVVVVVVAEEVGDVHGGGKGRGRVGEKLGVSIENAVADHRGNRDRYLATALTS